MEFQRLESTNTQTASRCEQGIGESDLLNACSSRPCNQYKVVIAAERTKLRAQIVGVKVQASNYPRGRLQRATGIERPKSVRAAAVHFTSAFFMMFTGCNVSVIITFFSKSNMGPLWDTS